MDATGHLEYALFALLSNEYLEERGVLIESHFIDIDLEEGPAVVVVVIELFCLVGGLEFEEHDLTLVTLDHSDQLDILSEVSQDTVHLGG